jgi:peptidoglycan/xylan/chitin deacetylase (PgdA/CDA1 family)
MLRNPTRRLTKPAVIGCHSPIARWILRHSRTGGEPVKSTIIRTGLEALYFSGAHLVMRPFCAGVGSILMLHHVRPPRTDAFQPNRLLEVAPEFLSQTVEWLRAQEIDIISLDEMYRRLIERDFNRRFVCITLDDGYRDNKVWAYPILKRHGAPFAIYIPTSFPERAGKLWWLALELAIARRDEITVRFAGEAHRLACATLRQKNEAYQRIYWMLRDAADEADIHATVDDLAERCGIDMQRLDDELCMNWDEIRELAADPQVTIGAHTVNHVMLAKADDEIAHAELRLGREALEAELDLPVRHLAYPYGGRDLVRAREFRMATELGYCTAVTTRPGVIYPEHAEQLMALPRISLNGQYQHKRHLKVLVSGAATALANGFRRVDAA